LILRGTYTSRIARALILIVEYAVRVGLVTVGIDAASTIIDD